MRYKFATTTQKLKRAGAVNQHMMLIRVSDNGPGTPDEVIDQVFDPFSRLVPQERVLGLLSWPLSSRDTAVLFMQPIERQVVLSSLSCCP